MTDSTKPITVQNRCITGGATIGRFHNPRDHSRCVPNQWETSLDCNIASFTFKYHSTLVDCNQWQVHPTWGPILIIGTHFSHCHWFSKFSHISLICFVAYEIFFSAPWIISPLFLPDPSDDINVCIIYVHVSKTLPVYTKLPIIRIAIVLSLNQSS